MQNLDPLSERSSISKQEAMCSDLPFPLLSSTAVRGPSTPDPQISNACGNAQVALARAVETVGSSSGQNASLKYSIKGSTTMGLFTIA